MSMSIQSQRKKERAAKSGLSRDIEIKTAAKYDSHLASQCLEWIQMMVNDHLVDGEMHIQLNLDGDDENFVEMLGDGCLLARVANILSPGIIPPSRYASPPKLQYRQMELIGVFLEAAKRFGCSEVDLFHTVDLYESQNLYQVTVGIQSIARKAQSKGMVGFGPKESDVNRRTFSEETLAEGRKAISLQMGTNQWASQKGMIFGKNRSILD